MTTDFDTKWRYGAYALATLLAAGAYLWLGSDSYAPSGPIGKLHGEEGLPALNFIDDGVEAREHRDLFAFVKFTEQRPEPVAPVVVAPPPPIEQAPPPPNLLADLRVIGLVRRPGQVSVLLEFRAKLRTVALGERFGAGDALSVASIDGRNVMIVDRVAKASKTFVLSEE